MKRGPKRGFARRNSLNAWLQTFIPGEVRYREYELHDQRQMSVLRSLGSTTRYPDAMKGWLFEGRRFLAIPATNALQPHVVLRIQRLR